MGYLSKGWSMEYHICFYIPKWLSWSVILKSSVCHLGKPCVTPVFKMVSKMAAISKSEPYTKCIIFFMCLHCNGILMPLFM